MVPVVVFSRVGCHLCDVARDVIERTAVAEDLKIELRVIDIDGVPDLRELYTDEVPVVTIAGKKAFKYRVDPEEFVRRVRRAEEKEKR